MKRRQFLKSSVLATAAGAGFPTIIPSRVLGADAPSKQITIGMIGVGNHGVHRNLNMFLRQPDARVVAVCDVYKSRMAAARKQTDGHYKAKGCSEHADFREILERDDIDAVMISTPDHWHSLMSAMALRRGKDVICEKPTLTIAEGRYIADLVKKTGRVFQTSTEDRSLFIYHHLASLVRNGRIGKLERIEVTLVAGQKFPKDPVVPVPDDLDWDLWLGPAPFSEFTRDVTEKQHWRHVFDYSGGKFSDWGMHQLDTAQWANDTERTGPVEVEGTGTVNEGSKYNTFIDYELNYRYANGVKLHVKSGGTAIRFYGSDGWCGSKSWDSGLEGSSRELLRTKFGPDDIQLYTCKGGEHRNFLDCVKSRKDPYFPAEIGHRCATLCHMGNISMQLGRKLKWDPEKEAFDGDDEANAMRSREMRKPWDLTTS